MDDFTPLGAGLAGLPLLSGARTRSVSPENPTGEKDKGAMAVPVPDVPDDPDDPGTLPFSPAASDLGQGWKVSPFVKVAAGETHTVMDVAGPGVIQHIWLVADPAKGRSHIIRFYWDGEETPSIETPVSDFFAVGHNSFAPVNSLAVVCNPKSAFNCYWPMPFRKSCRITFTNEDREDLRLLTYQVTYQETEVPEAAGYLHAQWRRAVTERSNPDYVIADGIRGQGKYVGTFLAWTQLSKGWFGEGEIKFYLDGDTVCRHPVSHHLRHRHRGLPVRQLRLSRKTTAPRTWATCTSARTRMDRPSGACTAGTSWIRSTSPATCASPSRRSAGGPTASTSRWRTTSPRWPTGTRASRTLRSPTCPPSNSAGRADGTSVVPYHGTRHDRGGPRCRPFHALSRTPGRSRTAG